MEPPSGWLVHSLVILFASLIFRLGALLPTSLFLSINLVVRRIISILLTKLSSILVAVVANMRQITLMRSDHLGQCQGAISVFIISIFALCQGLVLGVIVWRGTASLGRSAMRARKLTPLRTLGTLAKIVSIDECVFTRGLVALVVDKITDFCTIQEAILAIREPHVGWALGSLFAAMLNLAALGCQRIAGAFCSLNETRDWVIVPRFALAWRGRSHFARLAAWWLLPVEVEMRCAALFLFMVTSTVLGCNPRQTFFSDIFIA